MYPLSYWGESNTSCHIKTHSFLPRWWRWGVGRNKGKPVESVWAAERSVSMARPLLTFPIACDHILQRPQYRMKTVLEKQAWKKMKVSRQFVQQKREEEEGETEEELKCRTVVVAFARREGGGKYRTRGEKKWKSQSVWVHMEPLLIRSDGEASASVLITCW